MEKMSPLGQYFSCSSICIRLPNELTTTSGLIRIPSCPLWSALFLSSLTLSLSLPLVNCCSYSCCSPFRVHNAMQIVTPRRRKLVSGPTTRASQADSRTAHLARPTTSLGLISIPATTTKFSQVAHQSRLEPPRRNGNGREKNLAGRCSN